MSARLICGLVQLGPQRHMDELTTSRIIGEGFLNIQFGNQANKMWLGAKVLTNIPVHLPQETETTLIVRRWSHVR